MLSKDISEQWRREHLRSCKKQTGNVKIGGAVLVPGFDEHHYTTLKRDGIPGVTEVAVRCRGCGEVWRGRSVDA